MPPNDEARPSMNCFLENYGDLARRKTLRGILRDRLLDTRSLLPVWGERHSVRLLYCHYVFDDQVVQFEAIMKKLVSIGTFINSVQLECLLKGERPVDRTYFHLSFDDGFRNVLTNALPVLEAHSVPSTFFVPTAFIDSEYEVVRDYCLNKAGYPEAIEMASWEDLKRATDRGMEIGSHTRTHTRFSEISGDEARMEEEILGSRQDIEAQLGTPCRTISWPYGREGDADASSLAYARRSGYSLCFGAFRGQVSAGKTDAFRLPRHHFEPQWPLRHVEFFANGGMERE